MWKVRNRCAELCQASAQSTGALAAGGEVAGCRALLRTQGLHRAGKGEDQNWHGDRERGSPGPGKGLGSEPCTIRLVGLRAWFYSAVGLSPPPEPP